MSASSVRVPLAFVDPLMAGGEVAEFGGGGVERGGGLCVCVVFFSGVLPSCLKDLGRGCVSFDRFPCCLNEGVVDFVGGESAVEADSVGGGVSGVDCDGNEGELLLGGDVGVGEGEAVEVGEGVGG